MVVAAVVALRSVLMSDQVAGLKFHSGYVCSLRPVQLGQM